MAGTKWKDEVTTPQYYPGDLATTKTGLLVRVLGLAQRSRGGKKPKYPYQMRYEVEPVHPEGIVCSKVWMAGELRPAAKPPKEP